MRSGSIKSRHLLVTERAGFTYVGMLIIIAIIMITTAVVGQSLKLQAKREKEEELLWRGHQFRLAIERYYNDPKNHLPGKTPYPTEWSDLTGGEFGSGSVKYLRHKYTDPMTGKFDWVLDPPPGGNIIQGGHVELGQQFAGVHSISDAPTLKRNNFDVADMDTFTNYTCYSGWHFDYDPNAPTTAQTTVVPTGASPTGGTAPGTLPGTAPATPPGSAPGGTGPGTSGMGGF